VRAIKRDPEPFLSFLPPLLAVENSPAAKNPPTRYFFGMNFLPPWYNQYRHDSKDALLSFSLSRTFLPLNSHGCGYLPLSPLPHHLIARGIRIKPENSLFFFCPDSTHHQRTNFSPPLRRCSWGSGIKCVTSPLIKNSFFFSSQRYLKERLSFDFFFFFIREGIPFMFP